MSEKLEKHVFALGVSDLQAWSSPELQHRIQHVLRLSTGSELILFDRHQYQRAVVIVADRKEVRLNLLGVAQPNPNWRPVITVGLPLLQRAALETVLYNCVELGANQIQLIKSAKSERIKFVESHLARCERILIAAAEQSKNFSWPLLQPPLPLTVFLQNVRPIPSKICFDPAGQPLKQLLSINFKNMEQTVILAGPEGDFIASEKAEIGAAGFQACALTPTILRASQALTLGLGVWRSYFRRP